MSYAVSSALQSAVYAALTADAGLTALIGEALYDALPTGALPDLYVTLGPETVRDASSASGAGAWHQFTVSVVTRNAGFQTAKEAAGAVCDVLNDANLTLTRGCLVGMQFFKARAVRQTNGNRRIDLTFRARVDDTVAV